MGFLKPTICPLDRKSSVRFGDICERRVKESQRWIGSSMQQMILAYTKYDAEDVSHLSNNIVRVGQKLVLNDRGATKLVRELGREYENVKEIITIREIDCRGKKSHILGSIYFSDNGRVIKRESYEPIEWDSIIPDSVDDVLYYAVCKCLKSTPIWN